MLKYSKVITTVNENIPKFTFYYKDIIVLHVCVAKKLEFKYIYDVDVKNRKLIAYFCKKEAIYNNNFSSALLLKDVTQKYIDFTCILQRKEERRNIQKMAKINLNNFEIKKRKM